MLLSFILIPFVTALLLLFIKSDKSANTVAIVSTLGTLVVALVVAAGKGAVDFNAPWIPVLNAQFLLHADGLAKILVLLTAISFPAIIIATSHNQPKQKNIFLSLLLFTQSGLMGVFLQGMLYCFIFSGN